METDNNFLKPKEKKKRDDVEGSDERREMMLNKHSRDYKSLSQPMGIINSHFYL